MSRKNQAVSVVVYGSYVIDLNNNGIIVDTLEGFTELTGYSKEDVVGKLSLFDFLPAEDREEYIGYVVQITEGKIGTYLEHRFVLKSGEVINVLCFGDDYYPGDGNHYTKITICSVTDREELEEKYSSSQQELGALMMNIPGGVALYEIIGDELLILKANEEYYKMFGYGSEEGHPGFGGKLFRRQEVLQYTSEAASYIHKEKVMERQILFSRPDGSQIWLQLRTKFMGRSQRGNYVISVVFIDITDMKKMQRDLENQTERINLILENTDEIFYEYDIGSDTMILSSCINRFFEEDNRIGGYLTDNVFSKYIHPEDVEKFRKRIDLARSKPQRGSLQFRTRAFDDDYTWYKAVYVSVADENGKMKSIYGRLYCVESERKLRSTIKSDQAEIERLSTTDHVTGLLLRKPYKERIAETLSKGFEKGKCYAIIYSDINDFSYVNDNFGFDSGNQMLRDFAVRLSKSRITVHACRIYSDFYSCFVVGDSREDIIEEIRSVNTSFHNDQRIKYPASDLHISTGVYFLPNAEADITISIDNADLARRSVKGVKEIPCGIYSERMRKQRSHEQQIAAELKNALLTGQIELFLQPKFSLDKREIIGAEALSRWRNSDGTYKLPYEFINVLEKVGYIVDLDMYIYETLLKTLARWKREGYKLFPVSINFSRNHASHKNFSDKIAALADFYGIEPSLIEIEITESAFMQDFSSLYNDMKKLREKGFKIDIDDFGMGYSSLSVLLYAPVDIVKVDKVFIDNLTTSPQAIDYVNKICSLIDLTNKKIIFEGVETEAQAKILADSGHRMAQGWLFDKAISVEEFERKYMRTESVS